MSQSNPDLVLPEMPLPPELPADTPHCDHVKVHGEGVEWPIWISLEHFDDCLPADKRLRRWEQIRDMANRSIDCLIHHSGGRP